MPFTALEQLIRGCNRTNTTKPNYNLTEKANKGRPDALSEAELKKIPAGSLVFSVDRSADWSPYFNHCPRINKRCDYVLVAQCNQVSHICFIELKSTNMTPEGLMDKFRATDCFLEYCNTLSKAFWQDIDLKSAKKCFIVLTNSPLNKQPTGPVPAQPSSPECPKIINANNGIFFKQLIN